MTGILPPGSHLDDLGQLMTNCADLVGHAQDSSPQLVGIVDLVPGPIERRNEAVKRPDARLLLDQEESGRGQGRWCRRRPVLRLGGSGGRPPGEMTNGMAIGCDCLRLGPGRSQDTYFGWHLVYEPGSVARSLTGDHSWVEDFVSSDQPGS